VTISLLVEGDLEYKMVGSVLLRAIPQLQRQRLEVLNGKGWPKFLKRLPGVVRDTVEADSRAVVFSLCDLYQPDFDFPRGCDSRDERADSLKTHLKELVEQRFRPQFHPHLAVHEIEAWLFADRDLLRRYRINPPAGDPEALDFGEQSHPQARLRELWRVASKRGYRKVTDGVRLFEQVSIPALLDGCAYFRRMVADLESALALEGSASE